MYNIYIITENIGKTYSSCSVISIDNSALILFLTILCLRREYLFLSINLL